MVCGFFLAANPGNNFFSDATSLRVGVGDVIQVAKFTAGNRAQGFFHNPRNVKKTDPAFKKMMHRHFVGCVQYRWRRPPRLKGLAGQAKGGKPFGIGRLEGQGGNFLKI